MDQEKFSALVAQLEQEAAARPQWYAFKVGLLARLGNAYIGLMLLLLGFCLLALLVAVLTLKFLALKLFLVLLAFLWPLLKALRVRVPPPVGREIRAEEAPELFAMIASLQQQLQAPEFHQVLITDEFNAGVMQLPRLGLFGWQRNYLLLGLPLLQSLSVIQFQAVLAHEFGHLARGHGRQGSRIYAQRRRWSQLLAALEARNQGGNLLFRPFLNWFVPYFNAYSFPLARRHEYEADAVAAAMTTPWHTAAMLTTTELLGAQFAQGYWADIYARADDQPQPDCTPFSGLLPRLVAPLQDGSIEARLEAAMQVRSASTDTHPALADRLQALGEAPCFQPIGETERAFRLLGEVGEEIALQMDRDWQRQVGPAWAARHQAVQAERQEWATLNESVARGEPLSAQAAFRRAQLTESIGKDPADALRQWQALMTWAPPEMDVDFVVGARLLEQGDASGCPLLTQAMARNEYLQRTGYRLLRDFHWQQGEQAVAEQWQQRWLARDAEETRAEKERSQLLSKDRLLPHGLNPEQLAALVATLRQIAGLRQAWLVQKEVRFLPHRRCYVLGFTVSRWYQLRQTQLVEAVQQKILDHVSFPGSALVFCVEGNNARIGRRMRWRQRGSRLI